ncbi:MAG: hypothetical protein IPM03_01830 [Sulfuritalea sp.]|nr:hypothetical protein [Sulfuritalea sp.]
MRFRWEIRTGATWYAGTDATPYLSLAGDKGSMKEMELNDPDSNNDWEKGDVNHGVFETADLGDLKTGTLKHDGSGASPDWTVDYAKIINDEDGRTWLAPVNSELKGNQPFRLVFKLTDRGQYDEMQRRAKEDAAKREAETADADASAEEAAADKEAAAEERRYRKELERQKRQMQLELQKAKQEAELAKLRAQIDSAKNGGQTPPSGTQWPQGGGAGTVRTFEVFGIVGGRLAPMTSAIINNGGRWSVVPGASVMITEAPNEGYGLAGTPGRWSTLYAGRSPAEFGLDADKAVLASDGSRGWALPATLLAQIFGSNWRQAVYY